MVLSNAVFWKWKMKKKVILMQSFGFVSISRLNCNMILVCVFFSNTCVSVLTFTLYGFLIIQVVFIPLPAKNLKYIYIYL